MQEKHALQVHASSPKLMKATHRHEALAAAVAGCANEVPRCSKSFRLKGQAFCRPLSVFVFVQSHIAMLAIASLKVSFSRQDALQPGTKQTFQMKVAKSPMCRQHA